MFRAEEIADELLVDLSLDGDRAHRDTVISEFRELAPGGRQNRFAGAVGSYSPAATPSLSR